MAMMRDKKKFHPEIEVIGNFAERPAGKLKTR
jgi:hypothetical protein